MEIVRNKIKNIKSGLDIVIIVRPEILNKKFREIDENIYELFKRTKIIE